MTRGDWQEGERCVGMFLNGREIATPGPHGEDIVDDSFVLLFNAHDEDRSFVLPRQRMGRRWSLELSTAHPEAESGSVEFEARASVEVMSRSVVVLKRLG
jgi:isoamylase